MSLAAATRAAGTAGASIPLDEGGFLVDRRLWDRRMAQQIADHVGLGRLTTTQWLIIDFVRDRSFRLGALPPMRNLCRKLGVDREAVTRSFGSCRHLWQVAGLPNPGEDALSD